MYSSRILLSSVYLPQMSKPSFWIKVIFHLLFLTVPFFFTWVNEELFEFNKMLLVYGYTVGIVGLWSIEMILAKKIILKKTFLDLPILLFLISQLLSTLFSMHPRTSLFGYYTRFHGGLFSSISYVILFYAFVTHTEKKDLPRFLLSISLAAVGVGLYAISEHFGHSPSCLLINSHYQAAYGGDTGFWQLFGVDCWIQDVKSRVFATFGQPNWLAAFVITLLPVTSALTLVSKPLKKSQKNWLKWWHGFTTLILTMTLIFTQSRSGILGFGLGMIFFGLGYLWIYGFQKKQLHSISALAIMMAIPLLFWGSPFFPGLKQQLASKNQVALQEQAPQTPQPVNRLETGGTDSGDIRKIVWTGAIQVWKRYPLFGSGVETFAYSYYLDRPVEHNLVSEWDFLYNKAHNEFLNFLATTGIIGLISYIVLLSGFAFLGITTINKHKQKDSDTALMALAFMSGLAALTVSNFFGFSTVMVSVLLFLYPGFMIVQAQKDTEDELAVSYQDLDSVQVFGLVMAFLITCYFLITVQSIWRADHLFYQGKQLGQQQQYVEAVPLLEKAVELSPKEALFYQELGYSYGKLAVAFAQNGDYETAGQLAQLAETTTKNALALNPAHLNFYKALARVYILLAQINPDSLHQAERTLEAAQEHAPTDAKIMYNRSLVALDLGKTDQAEALMKQSLELKPNYEAVYVSLAELYENQSKFDQARKQYQTILDTIAPNKPDILQRIEILDQKAATYSAQQ